MPTQVMFTKSIVCGFHGNWRCESDKGDVNEMLSLRASLFLGCYTVSVVVVYRHFGQAYWSYFHGPSNLELHGILKERQPQIHRG
jgi:hypothetical protein